MMGLEAAGSGKGPVVSSFRHDNEHQLIEVNELQVHKRIMLIAVHRTFRL
jgi:hypothetical protein